MGIEAGIKTWDTQGIGDTIEEMKVALSDNDGSGYVTDMMTESPILSPMMDPTVYSFHTQVVDSTDCLSFVCYKGANTL